MNIQYKKFVTQHLKIYKNQKLQVSIFLNLIQVNNSETEIEKNEIIELFLGFVYLKLKEKKLVEEQDDLQKQIENFEQGNVQFQNSMSSGSYRKKRIRKKKTDIERHYKCTFKNCSKAYGSENSMNQHMKIKHPEFWRDLKNQEMRIFKSETIFFDNNQKEQKEQTENNDNQDNNDKDQEPINFDIEQ